MPTGFSSAQGNVGLKDEGDDCLLLKSNSQAVSSAVFTQSRFPGASVELSRNLGMDKNFQGLVVISKNANVATGNKGNHNAIEIRKLAAKALCLNESDVLIASTGVIGHQYPIEAMRNGIESLSSKICELDPIAAARAIMTTDTVPKVSSRKVGNITITGIAKGVGMIEPNMATLLAFFFTDADVDKSDLDLIFKSVANRTFNSLSIDTDTSTSDTACIYSNGLAGKIDLTAFEKGLFECALELTKQIALDGEGASKLIVVNVAHALDNDQAKRVGKSIVNSPLVKTAIYGGDPNWGRIIMAIGKLSDEKDITPDKTTISFGNIVVYPAPENDSHVVLNKLVGYLNSKEVHINVDLGVNYGYSTVYGCDLTENYIRINANYTT